MTAVHPPCELGDVESKLFRLPMHERVPRHYRLDVEPPAPSSKPASAAGSPQSNLGSRARRAARSSRDDSGLLSADSFIGRCSITFEIVCPVVSVQAAHFLVLHALELHMSAEDVVVEVLPNNTHTNTSAREKRDGVAPRALPGTPPTDPALPCIPCVSLQHWRLSETTSLQFAAPLPNKRGDRFCVHIRQYTGRIHPNSQGLYRSRPDDPLFLTTHLEPTNARRLLPCYDEPAFLSVFELSVVAEPGYTAVSNMPLAYVEPVASEDAASTNVSATGSLSSLPVLPSPPKGGADSTPVTSAVTNNTNTSETERATPLRSFVVREEAKTRRRCFFEPTPLLHTCIIAFTIGRYVIAERFSRRRGITCRVVVPEPDPLHSAWFALDLLIKAVDFFDAFFDYELPLRKIDLVALDNFDALGMENWGMIVLAKTHMLVSESTPIERRQRITRLVGHEVCHHWFGDWATVQWWNDLWLKEGVCRYLEYFFVDSVSPSWCVWNEFVGTIMDDAIAADADVTRTHPVRYCLDAPREIEKSFDNISYGKGAAILRMVFSILSPAQLQKAFHLVLVRYGASCFGLEEFQECVEDAIKPQTRRQRRAVPASNHDASAQPRSHPLSPLTKDAPGAVHDVAPVEGEDEASKLIRMVRQLLDLVNIAGHPYVLVRDTGPAPAATAPSSGSASPPVDTDTAHTTTYTISQYHTSLTAREVLAAYVHHRQRQSGPIDLLTPPVDDYFGWDPQKVLSPATPALCVPLRVMEIHTRLGACLPPRLEPLVGPVTHCAQPQLSRARTSPFTLALAAQKTGGSTSDAAGHGAQASDEASLPAMSPCSATTPSAGTAAFLSYFNLGGAAMLTCDYDTATWRQITEAAAYLTDEDRMSLTVTLARLRYIHIGHLAGENPRADRCTLFLEWILAITQSPRLMTSFLWDVVTSRLETLLFLTQNSYCNAGLCEFAENVVAPLHQRCLLTFFAREKFMVDGFEARVHLSFDSVMKMLALMALCHKPDYRGEAEEIRRWAFRDLFVGDVAGGSSNSSFTGMDTSLTNTLKGCHENSAATTLPGGGSVGGSASNSNAASPPPPGSGGGVGFHSGDAGGLGVTSLNAPQALSTRPSMEGIFFSSSVSNAHRASGGAIGGSSATLLSPFPGGAVGGTGAASAGTGIGGGGGSANRLTSSTSHVHWLEETSINLKRSAHISVIQTALFYLVELGDMAAWADVAAIAAHHLGLEVASLEEAIETPIPSLATVTEHGGAQRERRAELLADLFGVVVPVVFVLDDERAFPFMASVFGCFQSLNPYTLRLTFRNTRFLTFLLTNRLVRQTVLREMVEVGARLCSNGTIIALLKLNLAAAYGRSHSARGGATSHAAEPGDPNAELGNTTMAQKLDECRQLEFCGPASDDSNADEDDEEKDYRNTNKRVHGQLPDNDEITCDEAVLPRRCSQSSRSSTSLACPTTTTTGQSARKHPSHRRLRNLPEGIAQRLDAMEANCVWVDYCCEHYDRFVREARERYNFWATSSVSLAPSSCLTPLTADPSGARGAHNENNFGGVSI